MSRSPFPHNRSRPQLRTSLEGETIQNSSNLSPFQGLLRFSPRSPVPRSTKNTKQRFFNETAEAHDEEGQKYKFAVVDGLDIESLRERARANLTTHPSQAVFFASFVYHKTYLTSDAVLLAKAHFFNSNYVGCLRILDQSQASQQDDPWEALLLGCQALAKTSDWSTTEEIIANACSLGRDGSSVQRSTIEDEDIESWLSLRDQIAFEDPYSCHPLARLLWWRAKAHFELGDPQRASIFWKNSLQLDPTLQASFGSLLDHHLLPPREAHKLIVGLKMENQEWLRNVYLSQITVPPTTDMQGTIENTNPNKPEDASFVFGGHLDASSIQMSSPLNLATPKTPASIARGAKDSDKGYKVQQDVDKAFDKVWNEYKLQYAPQIQAVAAERAYRRFDWSAALSHCQDLVVMDPMLGGYTYVATLVTLGHSRVLFQLAHEWVEADPQLAQSWFAVGAYYYSCGRYHLAQRHFSKATRLDPTCVYSWIAFGCSFGACDESDQALASFRAAQRLSPGDHTALLYMGMEYVRTNHKVLANYFLQAALSTSGGDPLCWHELGTLALQKGEYTAAIDWLTKTLRALADSESSVSDCISSIQDAYWEPSIFNLGHALRKTKQYAVAQDCFQACTRLVPSGSTYAALGYTMHLRGRVHDAIHVYHQALSHKPDDAFVTTMLQRALEAAMSDMSLLPETNTSDALALPSPLAKNDHVMWQDDSRMSEGLDSDADVSMT